MTESPSDSNPQQAAERSESLVKGIKILEELCTGYGILDEQAHIDRALKALETEGQAASNEVAQLINDLVACRSPKLSLILQVAEKLEPSQTLIDAVLGVRQAKELTPEPAHCRFTPEIVGEGKVGWTTGTRTRLRGRAKRVLETLTDGAFETGTQALPEAELAGADLAGADFEEADLRDANLMGANLEGTRLSHATLVNANLEGANLRGASLYFANLTGATLKGADLSGANLYMSNLTNANLEGATLDRETYIQSLTLPNGLRGSNHSDLEPFIKEEGS